MSPTSKWFKYVTLACAAMLIVAMAGCAKSEPTPEPAKPATPATPAKPADPPQPAITAGGEAVYAMFAEPSKLDPHRTASNQAALVCAQVFETLVTALPEGEVGPGLAESWTISPDGLAYTFKLKPGVKFHDGDPFNAEAVKYNIERIMAPETMSEEAINFLGPFDKVVVNDAMTVTIHLQSRFEPLLIGLSDPRVAMVSPRAAEKHGLENFQDHMVGTGPFIFKEWRRREFVRVERNPDYAWAPPVSGEHKGPAYLDAIVFKFVPEPIVRAGMVESGEAQMTEHIAATDFPRLDSNPGITTLFVPIQGTPVTLLFNASNPPTDDLRVRQAMCYAIDQQEVVDTLYKGLYEPGAGPLDHGARGYWSGVEKYYAKDLAKAAALLDEAGWKLNAAGVREKGGQELVLTFPYHSGYPLYADPVLVVQAQLQQVGIKVDLLGGPAPAWLAGSREGTHNVGIVHWTSKAPYCLTNMYHSKNVTAFAWSRHQIPRIDEILDQLPQEMDGSKWTAMANELQQLIMDNALMKPLNRAPQIVAHRNELQGVRFVPGTGQQSYFFDAHLVRK